MEDFTATPIDEGMEAEAARVADARRLAGRALRTQAEPAPDLPDPAAEPENPYAAFRADPDAGDVGLRERARLNAVDSYYRGTLAGSGRMRALSELASSEPEENEPIHVKHRRDFARKEYDSVVADLARYDAMAPWSDTLEASSALVGVLGGSALSPESWINAPIKGATILGRTLWAAGTQAAIQTATDPVVQALSISGGTQKEYSPLRTAIAPVVGAVVGGGLHVGTELVSSQFLKRQLADLAVDDPALKGRWTVEDIFGPMDEPAPAVDLKVNQPEGTPAVEPPLPIEEPAPPAITPQLRQELSDLIESGAPANQIASHPVVVDAVEQSRSRPSTTDLPGYGTPEFQAARQFKFPDEDVVGYEPAIERLIEGARAFGGEVRKERQAIIVLGPPASGKSRFSESYAKDFASAIVDSDEIKKVLPEFEGGIGANAVHEESTDIMATMFDRMVGEGDNLIIPKVGARAETIQEFIEGLKGAGYRVGLVHIDVQPEEAYRRMIRRFLKTGRIVASEYFEGVGTKPRSTYFKLKGFVDDFAEINANGPVGTARVVDGDGPIAQRSRRDRDPEIDRGAQEAPTPAAEVAPIQSEIPNGIASFRPADLIVDANRFQFKGGGDEAGVTDRLKGVTTWDPIKAGMVLVWQDRGGQSFIVDGHQRLALAKRIGTADPAQDPQLIGRILREEDGITPEMARAVAAMKNIAEGTGTAVDAAKVIRDHPELAGDLPPRSELVRQARGLTNLDTDAFMMVVNEVVPPNYAAIVGHLVPEDAQLQAALLRLLSKTEPANAVQAEAIVRQGIAAGRVVEKQAGLFGEEDVAESLYLERAKVLDRALKVLRRDKTVFSTLVEERATVEAAGNKLVADINERRATADAQALQILQTLANRAGPISDALGSAARSAKDTGNYGPAVREFVAAVRKGIESGDVARLADGGARGAARAVDEGEQFDLAAAVAQPRDQIFAARAASVPDLEIRLFGLDGVPFEKTGSPIVSSVEAYSGDKRIGVMTLKIDRKRIGPLRSPGLNRYESTQGDFVTGVIVNEEFRRRGVATAMYQAVEKALGKPLRPSAELLDDGRAFWQGFRPEALNTVPTSPAAEAKASDQIFAAIRRERLGLSEEADDLRKAMRVYGRDEATLREVWQRHGPQEDWLDYIPEQGWRKAVAEWNARGHQIDPERYRIGSELDFEAFIKGQFPDRMAPFPGRREALQYFIERDPLNLMDAPEVSAAIRRDARGTDDLFQPPPSRRGNYRDQAAFERDQADQIVGKREADGSVVYDLKDGRTIQGRQTRPGAFETETVTLAGGRTGEQFFIPGTERSARQAAAARGDTLRGRVAQEDAGGMFAPREETRPDLFAARPAPGTRFPMERMRPDLGAPTGTSAPPATVGAPPPPDAEALRSLQQQVADLEAAIGFPTRQGRLRTRGAEGEFNASTGVTRVRSVADLETAGHEWGHGLETRVGARLTSLIDQYSHELAPLVTDPSAYPVSRHPNEGFAEFVRRYIGNPIHAQSVAPGFAVDFRNFMERAHPELLEALDRASIAYRAYHDASSVKVTRARVRFADEEPRNAVTKSIAAIQQDGFAASTRMVMQRGYEWVFDQNAPAARSVRELTKAIKDDTGQVVDLKAADNPEILLRLFARTEQAAVLDLMDGIRPYHSVTPEGPSLTQALAHAIGDPTMFGRWNSELQKEFSTYLVDRRSLVLWDKHASGELPNAPDSVSRGDAAVAVAERERKYPEFRAAGDMVHDYSRQLLRKMYEGGLISRDLAERLAKEPFYVPFMRDMRDRPQTPDRPGQAADGPGMTAVIQRMRGSDRDIKDPIESLMLQTFLVERTIRHNDVIRAFVNLARKAGPEGGRYVEALPAHEARKYNFDLEAAIQRKASERGMLPDEAKLIASSITDLFGEDPLVGSFFRMEPAGKRGEPIVFYKEGGELKAARFMSAEEGHALYELVTSLPKGLSDLSLQLLSTSSTVLRSGIVTNPVFALTNYIRDQIAVGILRPDYVPFFSGAKGIVSEFGQGESAKLYGYAGGVSAGASIAPLQQAANANVNALAKQGYLVNRLTSLHGFLELSSFTEAGTRNSVFDTVYQSKRSQGLSDYEAMIEGAYAAQDIIDFSRWGSKTLAVRALTPFVNAHLQGMDKAYRTLIQPLIREAVTTADQAARRNAVIALTKAAAVGGALGAAWAALHHADETYKDVSPELKATHFVTTIGNKVFVIPKPFELSLGFTAGEYAYQRLAHDDPRAAAQFAEAAFEVLKPPTPVFENPLIKTTFELATGKSFYPSFFNPREIVPDSLKRKAPAEQYTDKTSSLARWIGETAGVSPIKVDYAVGQYFGLWGRDLMRATSGIDQDAPAQNWEDMSLVRRFIKDPTRSSDITKKFWEFMGQTSGQYNQAAATYSAMVKGFQDSDAAEFLGKLPASERAFVIMKEAANPDDPRKPAFNADEKRLHPLQRAYDAVNVLNAVRRELANNAFKRFEDGKQVLLSPRQRGDVADAVRELAQVEMRNSFVIMKQPGYDKRPLMDTKPLLEKIRASAPEVANEIATRYATAKIYTTQSVAKAYPALQRELLRNGSDADLSDLAFSAQEEGFAFGAERVSRPQKRRIAIPPGARAP